MESILVVIDILGAVPDLFDENGKLEKMFEGWIGACDVVGSDVEGVRRLGDEDGHEDEDGDARFISGLELEVMSWDDSRRAS